MRRRRLLLRAVPLIAAAAVAFGVGLYIAAGSPERDAAERFGAAWEQGDFAAMYAELSPAAQAEYSVEELERAYTEAAATATLESVDAGEARGPLDQSGEEVVALPVSITTGSFGTVEGEIGLPVADGAIDWRPELVFPGLTEGDALERKSKLPERAPILAADRSPMAEGPIDARTTNGAGGIVAGEVGEPTPEQAKALEAAGFPPGTPAGTSGIELAFDPVLAGTPGGELRAVGDSDARVLASADPVDGEAVRTTIDPELQEATAAALGSTYGGAALIDADNGNVLAVAGLGFSAPQPPGSTFKIITLTGSLDTGITSPEEEFPVTSSAVVGGREVANAHDELCGGTLVESFAESCNSVFAPLGEELGGEKLVDFAERYGFNAPPSLYRQEALDAVDLLGSTIPEDLADEEAGVSAIGQGEVLATPLEMASVSQTIANRGVRSPTALVRDPELSGDYPDTKVTSPGVAKEVKKMMIEVVASGTGIAAALPDVVVAGKTGTAELGTTVDGPVGEGEDPEQEVDAWFTAFAPADDPKYAVAVMVVNAGGDGGTIAAPIARAILDAAL
jgi:peptidoglycan glycosyltransferase